MKAIFTLLFFSSIVGWSQVSGPITIDGRPMKDSISFVMADMEIGNQLVYTIVVNTKGEITSCKLMKTESNERSARLQITGKNLIISTLTFESGTKYPNFHQGIVTFTGLKE